VSGVRTVVGVPRTAATLAAVGSTMSSPLAPRGTNEARVLGVCHERPKGSTFGARARSSAAAMNRSFRVAGGGSAAAGAGTGAGAAWDQNGDATAGCC
jgi:nanoRNase/pAp phosphatase (c-di-AMP/oligoRNAs hydrolase)